MSVENREQTAQRHPALENLSAFLWEDEEAQLITGGIANGNLPILQPRQFEIAEIILRLYGKIAILEDEQQKVTTI